MPESPIRQSGCALADPGAGGEGVDGGGVDVRVGVEVEVAEPFVAREAGGFDPAGGAAPVPVVAFGHQQLGEETPVGELFLLRRRRAIVEPGADGRQPQQRQAWSMAASAACSVSPRRRRRVGVIVADGAAGLMRCSPSTRTLGAGCPVRLASSSS